MKCKKCGESFEEVLLEEGVCPSCYLEKHYIEGY